MNTKLALLSLAALSGLAFVNSASARPDLHVSIGFGAPTPVVRYIPAPVVRYAPAPAVAYCAPVAPVVIAPRPAGYWKEISVKTWVPATYVMSRDRFGRPLRMLNPGYFTYRTDRVWVNNCG